MSIQLTTKNFKARLSRNKILSLVQFKTEWSGACQIIDPVYKDLQKGYKGSVEFYFIDVDREKALADQYRITELPTILFFYGGEVIDFSAGLASKNKLSLKIENALKTINQS